MKYLKDYIHLYKGQQVKVKNNKYDYIGKLLGTTNDRAIILHPTKGAMEVVFKHCKPILRPLDEMTPDEAHEYIMEILNMKSHFGIEPFNYRISKGFLSIKTSEAVSTHTLIKNWGDNGDGEWVFNHSYSMADQLWLLERGFDIFGLRKDSACIYKSEVYESA